MHFSSYEFLLLFLPVTWAGFALLRDRDVAARRVWLLVCSAFFYAWWSPPGLALLAGSIAVNFGLGRALRALPRPSIGANAALLTGLVFNLGLLGYFKYAGFLVATAGQLTGHDWSLGAIVLPLAISFFTFQQTAFLIDAWRHGTPTGTPVQYALFVLFFPHLIAGPIVQHGDVVGQFAEPHRFRPRWEALSTGIAIFVIGLFKKVVIADALAPTANAVFAAAAAGTPLSTLDAWGGALAYTLQLYFDFSGYSDMAIGLGWLFGVRMPVNFDAPYQAASISDFWRRWHMTLSRFLRDYLYIPLGGSRCGPWRQAANLFVTMLLGGLWHGAGWTFIAWGALHGGYLAVNHAWSRFSKRCGWAWTQRPAWRISARGLTLLAVIAGWVLFRAADLPTAGRVLTSMVGFGARAPGDPFVEQRLFALIAILLLAVQVLPTTQRVVPDPEQPWPARPRWVEWLAGRPTPLHGVALSVALLVCVTLLTRVQEFLYFQF
jgi:alginate O-acetyltransferase complex protein AlgI